MYDTACAFSGYRPHKFPFPLDYNTLPFAQLQKRILAAVRQLAAGGVDTFLCGMAEGFDLMAADMVLELRETARPYQHVQLHCIMPYPGHTAGHGWHGLHRVVLGCADDVEYTSHGYHPGCFAARNQYLVTHASQLLCYWDGQPGGTANTVQLARERGLRIVNLAE